jgi:serine/threonine protein kinase
VRVVWSIFKRRGPGGTGRAEAAWVAGRYQLGAVIAEGAASRVHAATDRRTGAAVALKLSPLPVDLSLAQRADWLARMQREIQVAQRVAHPGVVALLDAGMDDHHAWLAMEQVRGLDLSRYIPRSRQLPDPLVLDIGARIAQALAHAHGNGVVHRDLKPANVLLDLAGGAVKLADFGVAREHGHDITRTGVTLGTPAYMAPELLSGAAATAASDAYALGVLLFELLTGVRPHQADTLGELLRAMAQRPAVSLAQARPDLPASVAALVDQLLRADPAQRPPDLAAWAAQAASLAALMLRVLSRPSPIPVSPLPAG